MVVIELKVGGLMIIVFLIIVLVFVLPSINKKRMQHKNDIVEDEQITLDDIEELSVLDSFDDKIDFLGQL